MRVLRRSKAVEILFALSEGPKHIRELQSKVGGSASTIEARVQELLKDGLIRERKLDFWPFRKELELSERGREVVRVVELQGSLLSLAARKPPEERTKWIFALLHAMGGKIRGRLRLQKLLFLLKHECGAELPYEFIPYMYGPYSADIFEDIAVLKDEGFLEVRGGSPEPLEIIGDRTAGMSYILTKRGEEKAVSIYEELPNEMKRALSSLKKFNEMGIRELVRYVYDKYPHESLGAARREEVTG
jgi:uncharacterized protein YwgA/DNA-binding HxlR family transcriptional regulator